MSTLYHLQIEVHLNITAPGAEIFCQIDQRNCVLSYLCKCWWCGALRKYHYCGLCEEHTKHISSILIPRVSGNNELIHYTDYWIKLRKLIIEMRFPPTDQVVKVFKSTENRATRKVYPEKVAQILTDVHKIYPHQIQTPIKQRFPEKSPSKLSN